MARPFAFQHRPDSGTTFQDGALLCIVPSGASANRAHHRMAFIGCHTRRSQLKAADLRDTVCTTVAQATHLAPLVFLCAPSCFNDLPRSGRANMMRMATLRFTYCSFTRAYCQMYGGYLTGGASGSQTGNAQLRHTFANAIITGQSQDGTVMLSCPLSSCPVTGSERCRGPPYISCPPAPLDGSLSRLPAPSLYLFCGDDGESVLVCCW